MDREPRITDLADLIGSFGFVLPDSFGVTTFAATLSSPRTPVMFRLEYTKDTRQMRLFPWVRTSSWQFDGERTDIHDIVAIVFAATLTAGFDMPTRLWYEQGMCGPMEMDTVFVSLEQSQTGGFSDDDGGVFDVARIIIASHRIWASVAKCGHDKHQRGMRTDPTDTGYDYKRAESWAATIARSLRRRDDFRNATYSQRQCPEWAYFHDYGARTAVVRSDPLARYVANLASTRPTRTVEGVDARLLVSGACRNVVPNREFKRAGMLLRTLEGADAPAPPSIICLENRLIVGGWVHLVAIFCDCSRAAFDSQRERVRARFEAEAEILFPATEFKWASDIPDDQFEQLVCELLVLERGVCRVRRAGVTRERDGGRDLIAEWIVPTIEPKVRAYKNTEERQPLTVVVQCKTSNKTIGKGHVLDIRDTVDVHSANGYFVAVSSQLSGPLITHLESLRRHGWFIEWWTRLEIEARLRRHPDVAERYCEFVRRKDDDGKGVS